jgi:hypothetical protein
MAASQKAVRDERARFARTAVKACLPKHAGARHAEV